ncbi:DUF397 domain-containing protein [Micromonospora sp. NPDC049366]|uniref:DUF397 domain-containing protein n=1 Tax=Micromonospora sp. NPDC049366 TaxID=3364271 RepID=UPI0037A9A071
MDTPDHVIWRKSSYSDNNGGACVELATKGADIMVRDSKNPGGAVLRFHSNAWNAFVRGIKFD